MLDEMEEVRLGELKKYVPFMDYILTLDYQYKDKFAKMRKWMIENKKFSKEYFDKIEKSIIVTYKDFCRHEGFPIELHKIFTVDLCSDDESDIHISTEKAKKVNQQKTPAVLKLQHVTISDNDNDDDVEIVCVSKSNVVDLTKDKKSPKKRFERSASDLDINDEIFIRINATKSTRNDPPRVITPLPDAPPLFATESAEVEDRLIFKRRKDFTEKENTFSELNDDIFGPLNNDVVVEQNPSDEIRLKAKKKKKKHKKEKHRRHDKNRLRKKKFKVIENIVIDSSTDDESAISNSSKTAEAQVETKLNGINNLNEKELLKIKCRIINEIQSEATEATEANKSKEIEKEKCNENLRNIMSDNNSNKKLDETELLQMKDNLMKTMGVNINTEKLLENLNLSNLNDKSSSPTNIYVGRSIPTLISNTNFSASNEFQTNQCTTSNIPPADPNSELKKLLHPPKVTEISTQPISNVYNTIPTIENHFTHPRHSFTAHQIQRPINPHTRLPNVNIPVPIQTILPMPQPKNIPSYINATNISSIPLNYQHSNLITIPTTTTMPKATATHFNGTTQLPNEMNFGCTEATSSIRQPLLSTPPPHPSQISAVQSFHPAVVQQPHPRMPHPVPTSAPPPPLHPIISQQPHHQIPHQLHTSAPPPLHPAVSHQPHRPVSQPVHPTIPQSLHAPVPHPLHGPVPQPLHAPVPQPLHAPVPQPLHAPVPQPLHEPAPSRLPAFDAQHSAMLAATSASMPSQLSQRPQLAAKDPRLRRMHEQGQYGNNRPPSTVAQPIASTTKSPITYGQYVRNLQRKKQLEAEMKQQKEAAERAENQRKLEENQRKMQIEKEHEKMEHQRQTESIKEILNKHSIVDILAEMVSKQQNQKNVSENSERNGKKDKPDQDAGDRLKLMERRKSCSNTSRALKELECTVKGFNTMQDFLVESINGKRRSSVSARKAIASILTPSSETGNEKPNSNESNSPTKNKKRRISMESIDDEIEQVKRLRQDLEFRVKKAKRIPKMKKCKVVIHRLSSSEIDRYMKKPRKTNNPKSHKNSETASTITTTTTSSSMTTTLMTEKTASPKKFSLLERTSPKSTNDAKRKSQEKTYARKSTEPFMDIKNIDCTMTERNCDKCVLCNSRSANLTNHYIRVHKRESYLSRLTWEELDDLQMKVPFAEEVRGSVNKSSGGNKKVQRFKVECPFCPEKEREVDGSFAILRQHYSMHTGEYAYQCKGCGQQKPFRREIVDHQKRTKCNGMGLQTLYLYPTDLMVIYMYVCNICNFVQLNEENVFKHLREQHGKLNRDAKLVKQFTLAAIKDGPLERVPVGNFAEIPSMENFFDSELFNQEGDNGNIVVGNEPLLDDSYNNIFKPEPLDEDNEYAWDTRALQMQPKEKLDQEEDATETTGSKNVNLSIFLETSAVDIKPEISTIDQNLLENGRRPPPPLTADIEVTEREEDENKPDVELLTFEAIKALLQKYSSNTGIRPDLLYQCPRPDCRGYYSNFNLWSCHMNKHHNSILSICPHCKIKKNVDGNYPELPIADFEQHFRTHCMRLYVCFHCDTQCVDESELRAHAKESHADIEEVRIECIPISCSYAYHILINKNVLLVRLEFLLELCTILRARIQHMEAFAEESDSVVSQWTISNNPAWLDELSIPIFHPSACNPKCIFPSCLHSFANPLDLVEHWKDKHNTYKDHLFSCRLCGTSSPSKTLATLVKHNFMHAENIYVCSVCSYMTYDRKLLSKHICAEHDKRDVCALILKRSKSVIKVKIEFVFATGSKTFSTTNSCLCGCGAKNLRVDTYVSHLKREHLLKLRYFCEHCGERLMHLQTSDEHFLLKHAAETGVGAKIRCQLACSNDREVNILSIRPMQIRLSDEDYEIFQNEFGSPKKALVNPETVIKSEINDNEADEPIIMDDDEIVAENEAKRAHTPQKPIEGSKICVKNNWKLF